MECSRRIRDLTRKQQEQREFFIDNLLGRIHFIIVMIRWTGLAPREFEFPFSGSLTSTFLAGASSGERSGALMKRQATMAVVPTLAGMENHDNLVTLT